tara:strand:- start:3687 stop:3875 length:189 start_codon:yes stop_codon:yes gene_type:complete
VFHVIWENTKQALVVKNAHLVLLYHLVLMIYGEVDVNTTKQEVALNVLVVNCQDTSERGAMI